jgi:hypothetical protein
MAKNIEKTAGRVLARAEALEWAEATLGDVANEAR